MKKCKIPSKVKNNVFFNDPVTLEVRCNFNDCRKKFTQFLESVTVDKREDGTPIVHYSKNYVCEECGVTYRSKSFSKESQIINTESLDFHNLANDILKGVALGESEYKSGSDDFGTTFYNIDIVKKYA